MMWQVEDWFWQDTSLSSCFCWRPSGKGKKLSYFFISLSPPVQKMIETLCVCHFQGRQPCSQWLGRAETPLSWPWTRHLVMPQLPMCKSCKAALCFASTKYQDPFLDIQVRRDKNHSAQSRHYEAMKIRTKCYSTFTSQQWTHLDQNPAHPTSHF